MASARDNRVTSGEELDIGLLTFVKRYAANPVRWDIVTFFGRNSSTQGAANFIAQALGSHLPMVYRELEDLVVLGLLEQSRVNGDVCYHLTHYEPLRQAALHFVKQLNR